MNAFTTFASKYGLISEFTYVKPADRPASTFWDREHLCWKVVLRRHGVTKELVLYYRAGIGHIPTLKKMSCYTLNEKKNVDYAVEKGVYPRHGDWNSDAVFMAWQKIPAPDIGDLLECLRSDCGVIDYSTDDYEAWAADYGFDPDSRQGEALFRECMRIASTLRVMLGAKAFEAFRALEEDA